MHDHSHDSCSPDLERDLRVTGQLPPSQEHKIPDLAELNKEHQATEIAQITAANLKKDLIELSHKVPVIVLIGNSLQATFSPLKQELSQLASHAGLSWSLALVDPDRAADVASQFRPRQLPVVYAVVGGTSVSNFEPGLPGIELADWLEDVLSNHGTNLPGLAADATPAGQAEQPMAQNQDHRLWQAAEAVNAGDFAQALDLYKELLQEQPQNPTLLRAQAAVSVLQRVQESSRESDPIALSAAQPQDISQALKAADALVMLDQPLEGVEKLSELLHTAPDNAELRARLRDLLFLVDPQDPRAMLARQNLAAATFN